jgi:hypothetical protein
MTLTRNHLTAMQVAIVMIPIETKMNRGPDRQAEPGWQAAGEVGVDTGYLMLSGPGYWMPDDEPDAFHPAASSEWTWAKMVELLVGSWPEEPIRAVTRLNYRSGHAGLGMVVGDFGGDGTYPVYVQRGPGGSIVAVQMPFDRVLPEKV